MKLLRYGPAGQEKPGVLDRRGQIRDLSGVIPDISADTIATGLLATLQGVDVEALPPVPGTPRIGPCIGRVGNCIEVDRVVSVHPLAIPAPQRKRRRHGDNPTRVAVLNAKRLGYSR